MCFETECVMAVQGHPRSLISVSFERECATYKNSEKNKATVKTNYGGAKMLKMLKIL